MHIRWIGTLYSGRLNIMILLIMANNTINYRNVNKIVQRFYETRLCRSVWRKAKIPILAAPKTGFPLRFNTLLGYFGIFTTAHRAVVPHFRFKKDLILYLNSSRAASSGEFKFKNRPFTAPQFLQH